MIQVGNWVLDARQEHNAIGGCRKAFGAGSNSVLLVAPTGAGKTVITSALADMCSRKGKTIGIIMSGRTLIFQMSDTLVDAQVPHTILMADSGHKFDPKARVAVISKDTFESRANSLQLSGWSPDLWMIDEADVCISPSWQGILKSAPQKIGLTATPCDGQGKGLGHIYDSMVVVANYSELIKDGRLVDVPQTKCFSPIRPDLTGISTSAGEFNSKSLSELMGTRQMVGDVVAHWERLGEDRPTLVCCVNKKHTADICQEFNFAGIAAEYVIDSTSQTDREAIFKRVKDGTTKVIVNCATLTRGFDLPEITCLVLAKPTKRLRSYIQMVGRALRYHKSKKYAIIIDHSGAVWEHGWPTQDREWTLDTNLKVEELAANKKPSEAPDRFCPKCTAIWKKGSTCPNCGYTNPSHGQKATMANGQLVSVKPKEVASKKNATSDSQKAWASLLGRFGHADKSYAQAAVVFYKKTGQWPEQAGVSPVAPKRDRNSKVAVLFPGFARKKKKKSNVRKLFS